MSITKISPDVVDFDSALVVSPTLTIGDATAEDTKIVFDGNAQDYYVGLDDSADDLVIGLGSTVGTTPAIIIDENLNVGIGGTPGVTLDVNGGSTTQLRLTASDSTSASIINFGDQDNVAVGRIIYSHVDDSFSFKTNNVNDRLVIDSSGNVGIGADAVAVSSSYAQLNIGSLVTIAGETASGASKSLHISHNAHLDTDSSWEAIATDEATNYYQHGGAHAFRVAAATTGGTDISWTTVGQFNTNGLCFGTDTAAANALDDYEEGTWTPTLESYQGNTLDLSSYTSVGTYTKIGRQVTVMIYIVSLTFNSGTNTDYIQITLPFSAHGGSAMVTNSYGAGSLTTSVVDFAHEHSRPSFLTTSKIGFLGSNQDGGTWAWEPYSALPTSGSTAAFRITFTYFVA